MKREEFQALQRKWYDHARESGFRDIEAPSGVIARRSLRGKAQERAAENAAARAFLLVHVFACDFDRDVWELHSDGLSNRKIASRLSSYRKKVDATVERLQAAMYEEQAGKKRRGRPRDDEGFRAEGLAVRARLLPAHLLALDRIRAVLKVSAAEAVRRGLQSLAGRLSGNPKSGGQ